MVVFDYPLDPNYLGSGSDLPPGGFSQDNDKFFRASKDALIHSKEFNQVINPTKETQLTRSRVPHLGIM